MTMLQIVGVIMFAGPLLIGVGFMAKIEGWAATAFIVGGSITVTAIVVVGAYLMTGGVQ